MVMSHLKIKLNEIISYRQFKTKLCFSQMTRTQQLLKLL